MKKIVSVLCGLAIAVIAVISSGTYAAYAGTYEEESDLVFRKAMEEILIEESVTAEVIKVAKEPVYDLSLDQLGFIYIMQYDTKEGFALVINTYGAFDVVEFYMEAPNPYEGYEGQNVYASFMFYLVYTDGNFIETETGKVLNDENVLSLKEKAFSAGTSGITTGFETIYYTNKSENKFELTKRHPTYYPVGADITNACVPAAGANVIGFWTRYYPELVPGFTPGSIQLGQYLYKECPSESNVLVADLFYAMATNSTAPGTTIEQFENGMNNYVNGKGRNIDMTTCAPNGNFNYSLTKQKLEGGLPLVLFVDCFRVDEITNYSTNTSLYYMITEACHAMAGFGYNEITYTLADGSSRTDTYIQVATGLGSKSKGYYNINYNTLIDQCFAISIY